MYQPSLSRRALLLVLLCLASLSAHAVTLVQQTFTTGTATGWTMGGGAKLTSGNADTTNNGWLRLTDTGGNEAGYAYYSAGTGFASSQGFVIDFDFASWGGSGADGLIMFLYDATATFRAGAAGGSLSYANDCSNVAGMRNAYIGIAFDEFGNFANPADRCKSGGPGVSPESVTIRGAGNYTSGTVGTNYQYLTSSAAGTNLDCTSCSSRPVATSSDFRHARITMILTGTSTWQVYVDVQFGYGQPYTRVIAPYTLPTAPYSTLRIGFAGSTGGSTNYHEIRNLKVTNPVDTSITKTVSSTDVAIPGAFTYTLGITNSNITAATNVKVVDTMPTGQVTYVSATPSTGGTCSYAAPTLTCTYATIVSGGTASITVNAKGATQGTATNSVTIDQDDIDINPNNNSASVSNNIWNLPSLTVVKSSSVTNANPGSPIVYTITVTNSGGISKTNQLTDNMSQFTALNMNYAGTGQPFQLIPGTTGLTLGTPVYSKDNGATWTYTLTSGAGGAPAGYDAVVTNFRIPLTGNMAGGGANYSVKYGTVVE